MAIDPTQVTTIWADELPPAAITPSSIVMHAIGETLYKGLVSEIMALVPSVNYQPYEVKWLNVTNAYVADNFELNGLGKTAGLWPGWQIMNGNNGTENMDNAVALGFGSVRNTMRESVGENSKVLVKNNIPILDVALDNSSSDNGDPGPYVISSPGGLTINRTYTGAVNKTSTNTPVSIMQKSIVQLFIMKLP
jgi:hypothetical protein